MTKPLIKLIDFSLLPAALLIVGKFFGLYVSIQIFKLEWGLRNIPNSLFSIRAVFYSNDIVIASTYSDLVMFLVILLGFSFILIQALYFHASHIEPTMIARLASKNLLHLIQNSFELYTKASVWLLFLWMSDVVIFLNTLTYKTELWVLILSIVLSVIATVILLRDVQKEIELGKQRLFSGASSLPKLDY